ncbi:MAG: sugar phosphate isomerase/epimerase, partial [Limisphaerales bacterium]
MNPIQKITALLLLHLTILAALAENKIPEKFKQGGFVIGCQAYTFKEFSLFEAIEKTASAGGNVIELFPKQKISSEKDATQFNHDATDEMIGQVKAKLAEHKMKAVNYGVVDIPQDETAARKIFEFAKKMGLRAVTTESENSIDTIEKLVKEYDILVGFHDHPKRANDPSYKMWDPNHVLALV